MTATEPTDSVSPADQLRTIDRRQDALLDELETLNRRIEQAIAQARPASESQDNAAAA